MIEVYQLDGGSRLEGPAPQPLIGARAGERVGREGLGVGEGQIDRPQDEAVDEDEGGGEARRQHDLRQGVLQARAQRRRRRHARGVGRLARRPSSCGPPVFAVAHRHRRRLGKPVRGRRAARRRPREMTCRAAAGAGLRPELLLRVVDRLDELGHGLVRGLDLAVDELGHDVLVGIGDRRRRAIALGERAEQRAASRWRPSGRRCPSCRKRRSRCPARRCGPEPSPSRR